MTITLLKIQSLTILNNQFQERVYKVGEDFQGQGIVLSIIYVPTDYSFDSDTVPNSVEQYGITLDGGITHTWNAQQLCGIGVTYVEG